MFKKAFSLIVLLVVISIISIILAILLPTLSKIKEKAYQINCLSNIKQINNAFIMYANNNQGFFPSCAPAGTYNPNPFSYCNYDWIYWQTPNNAFLPKRNIYDSPILKYIDKNNINVLKCSTFQPPSQSNWYAPMEGIYNYSYVASEFFCFYGNKNRIFHNIKKYSNYKNPSQLVLIAEEDQLTIDDGSWWPKITGNLGDYLSIKHDKNKYLTRNNGIIQEPEAKGNVSFLDGHAEFISRKIVHNPKSYDPDY